MYMYMYVAAHYTSITIQFIKYSTHACTLYRAVLYIHVQLFHNNSYLHWAVIKSPASGVLTVAGIMKVQSVIIHA